MGSPKVAFVIVELAESERHKQIEFRKVLFDKEWHPYPGISNAYSRKFDSAADYDSIIKLSEEHCSLAAVSSRVADWNATCVVSGA